MDNIGIEDLKKIESIKNVPDEQLQWLIDVSERRDYEPREFLFQVGDPVNRTFIILEGKFRLCLPQNGKVREMASLGPLHITGFLPFSRGTTTAVYGECTHKITSLIIPAETMMQGAKIHYELTEALVHIMTTRVREFTAFQQQNEKMVALGKLSAGLAHELNNPAAAIARDASTLKKQIKNFPELLKEMATLDIEPEEVEPVNEFIETIIHRPDRIALSMIERADQEDEITDWLDDHEIKNYEMAETLVDFGFSTADLDKLEHLVSAECIAPVLMWVNNNLITDKIVTDIQESSRRISELVGSVKNFTHMDRDATRQLTDVHSGIDNTLKMLGYKLKKNNIELKLEYHADVPMVVVQPGEMNQVWTNLIDNAIDAMEPEGKGVLIISTQKDGDFVQVKVIDNGPGVPEDIKTKIFDPFFTTKDMGKGTGMGLDVVNRIVRQHNGSIKLTSKPGNTEFEVCLPLQQ